jgi:hypothetical protein
MLRSVRRLPFFKLIAVLELMLLARRHLTALDPSQRSRLVELTRRAHRLTPAERDELRDLAAKLEPRAFAAAAADALSPLPLPQRLLRGRRR